MRGREGGGGACVIVNTDEMNVSREPVYVNSFHIMCAYQTIRIISRTSDSEDKELTFNLN